MIIFFLNIVKLCLSSFSFFNKQFPFLYHWVESTFLRKISEGWLRYREMLRRVGMIGSKMAFAIVLIYNTIALSPLFPYLPHQLPTPVNPFHPLVSTPPPSQNPHIRANQIHPTLQARKEHNDPVEAWEKKRKAGYEAGGWRGYIGDERGWENIRGTDSQHFPPLTFPPPVLTSSPLYLLHHQNPVITPSHPLPSHHSISLLTFTTYL